MRQSHVIEVRGEFAGAAVSQSGAFCFVAVDPRVERLDRSHWSSLPEVQRAVGQMMISGGPKPSASGQAQ